MDADDFETERLSSMAERGELEDNGKIIFLDVYAKSLIQQNSEKEAEKGADPQQEDEDFEGKYHPCTVSGG
jgi:hypothetical protein